MTTQITLDRVKTELALAESELDTLKSKGTNASAVRARAHLLNIKKECDDLRKKTLLYFKELKATTTTKEQVAEHVDTVEVVEPVPVPEEDKPIVVKKKRVRKVPAGRKQK